MNNATLCSIPDAIALSGIGRSFLYMRLADKSIRSVKAGRRRLVDVASLNQWMASLPEQPLKVSEPFTAPLKG
jgi:excisionase family DNA binding protein